MSDAASIPLAAAAVGALVGFAGTAFLQTRQHHHDNEARAADQAQRALEATRGGIEAAVFAAKLGATHYLTASGQLSARYQHTRMSRRHALDAATAPGYTAGAAALVEAHTRLRLLGEKDLEQAVGHLSDLAAALIGAVADGRFDDAQSEIAAALDAVMDLARDRIDALRGPAGSP